MQPLRAALAHWQPGAPLRTDPLSMVRAVWPQIVGDEIAAHSSPREIARETLIVTTRSSAWSQQLAFLSERLLAEIRTTVGEGIERLRFRVGHVPVRRGAAPAQRPARRRTRAAREPAQTLEGSLERFRCDVVASQRAKASAGWKECVRCGARIDPRGGSHCVACENARVEERSATVARLLFEAPWLGYAGIAPLVQRLTTQDYDAVRRRLLARWWDVLVRLRRSGRKVPSTRERLIASSYVLLKSNLDPERIAPAVVRDLLGDELHDLLYVNEGK